MILGGQATRFSNKGVIVTGAAGGIGNAIVRRSLSEGAKVCAVGNQVEALQHLSNQAFNQEDYRCI